MPLTSVAYSAAGFFGRSGEPGGVDPSGSCVTEFYGPPFEFGEPFLSRRVPWSGSPSEVNAEEPDGGGSGGFDAAGT